MWKCPKCRREFAKRGQGHSCTVYPLANHFKNKEHAKTLYDELLGKLSKKAGKIKVESLPCCIHLVSSYTFGCVYALRSGIRIHFSLQRKMESPRVREYAKVASKRFMHSVDVKGKKEIDAELLGWLKEASG
ncbi:MAG: DUF5655 domain-containing protein [Candidatus ainarchaeum sp.]|nr:DUF5655 domain-containing protein [Candidatus ainarchaeum sp.]